MQVPIEQSFLTDAQAVLDSAVDVWQRFKKADADKQRIDQLGQEGDRKVAELRTTQQKQQQEQKGQTSNRAQTPITLDNIPEQIEINKIVLGYRQMLETVSEETKKMRHFWVLMARRDSRFATIAKVIETSSPAFQPPLPDLIDELRNLLAAPPVPAQTPVSQGQIPEQSSQKMRGRPGIPEDRKIKALKLKEQGASNRECAKVLYNIPDPTQQQARNAKTILDYYRLRQTPPSKKPSKK